MWKTTKNGLSWFQSSRKILEGGQNDLSKIPKRKKKRLTLTSPAYFTKSPPVKLKHVDIEKEQTTIQNQRQKVKEQQEG